MKIIFDKHQRHEALENSLSNAEHMLKMEREISAGRGWSESRRQAARAVIPQWESRVQELKSTLSRF